jgi:hypothetical protein
MKAEQQQALIPYVLALSKVAQLIDTYGAAWATVPLLIAILVWFVRMRRF